MKKIILMSIVILSMFIFKPTHAKADPFLGEIRATSFNFAPKGWALCNGQLLPINQNTALFSLLGTTYGGNGTTTFALPDLRGRAIIHEGNGHIMGEHGGEETHTLTVAEMPAHSHTGIASAADSAQPEAKEIIIASTKEGNTADPTGSLLAKQEAGPNIVKAYVNPNSSNPININNTTEMTQYNMKAMESGTITVTMPTNTLGSVGNPSPQPFNTMEPYLTVNYIIALQGVFPSQN